jgi:phage terminase small subunit
MPQEIIRDGKKYYEYTMAEIEAVRMRGYVNISQRSGRTKVSPLMTQNSIGDVRRNTKRLAD